MAHLNLLPWRDAKRQRQKRLLTAAGLSAVSLTLGLAVASYLYLNDLLGIQESRNTFLIAEIARLDRKILEIKDINKKKADLLARLTIIQDLQHIRPEVVHLFDEIVNAMPEWVYLTGIRQNGNTVILQGQAQSYGRISDLMRNIHASAWMTNPTLNIIREQEKVGAGLNPIPFNGLAKTVANCQARFDEILT